MIQLNNRVALYARFSSDNQRTESIDAQLRAMRGYCEQHHFAIVNTYVDEAKSATTDRRPAFQQMISDSATRSFDILLVHKLDRFARNRYDSAIYKRELKKNGVMVYSVLENLDSSPESVIRVAERMSGHKREGGRRNAKERYLLSGKVFCKDCGRAMVGNARHSGRNKALQVTYRCPSQRHVCRNKEINRDYLERYVVGLLEQEIFSPSAMRGLAKRLEKRQRDAGKTMLARQEALQRQLNEVIQEAQNIADAIAQGLLSPTLAERLEKLEAQREQLTGELARLHEGNATGAAEIDLLYIPKRYAELKQSPAPPEFKSFIADFVARVVVGRYRVELTVKTGLGLDSELDSTMVVRREDVYRTHK